MSYKTGDDIQSSQKESIESQIVTLLDARFGDGMAQLPKVQSRRVFKQAVDMGFIDAEGYLTRKGRTLLTQYRFHH